MKSILLVGGCGYIGSFLYGPLLQAGLKVTVCDTLARGNSLGLGSVVQADYADLDAQFLSQFDAVLWFAGVSSVGASLMDPGGAMLNNCTHLYAFARRLQPHTRLIYASSASVYSAAAEPPPEGSAEDSLVSIPQANAYDISKFAFDYLAMHSLRNVYGLRMGTLAGYSPNLRPELVFNAMNLSATTDGVVRVQNGHCWRTLLLLDDLSRLVLSLVQGDHAPGIYNAGSVSLRIGDLARCVAATWGARVQDNGESATYSFRLNTKRMTQVCGVQQRSMSDIEPLCRQFIAELNREETCA